MSEYRDCPRCAKPVIPTASDSLKASNRICLCDERPARAPRMPVDAPQETKRVPVQTTPPKAQGRNKYGARKTEYVGHTFDSKKEADCYQYLQWEERAGKIQNLELQPRFDFVVNEVHICSYKADFRYVRDGVTVVVDCKSEATRKIRDYPIRKKLLLACYGIEVTEV